MVYYRRLGQQLETLYRGVKRSERQELIRTAFDSLILGDGQVCGRFTRPFEALQVAVAATNSSKIRRIDLPAKPSFELVKIGSQNKKTSSCETGCLVWREAWDAFRTITENTLV